MDKNRTIKTRFAPSPTGLMHIGSIRTALYAFLEARKYGGKYLLRIEDTDRNRFVEGSIEDIVENLMWLGLTYDEGPILQSDRKEIYRKHAEELVEKGAAYKADGAIWFRIPKDGKTEFIDLIGNRKIEFENKSQKDFVLLKSDGYPTYHLAHVVDDHLMETDPVIRAEEWLPSTPKHILTFQAFGWNIPRYAHIPLILGTDRSKLSKRHGAKGVTEFRKEGFLPEAILNYMALLGWTPPSGKEMLTLEEMINEFDIKDVHVPPAVFDIAKLEWMNGEYIRKTQDSKLKDQIYTFYEKKLDGDLIGKIIPLIKERIKKLSDFLLMTEFFFVEPTKYEIDLSAKADIIKTSIADLEKIDDWKADIIGGKMQETAKNMGVENSEYFMTVRVALTGKKVTPPLNESMEILGKDKTVSYLEKSII